MDARFKTSSQFNDLNKALQQGAEEAKKRGEQAGDGMNFFSQQDDPTKIGLAYSDGNGGIIRIREDGSKIIIDKNGNIQAFDKNGKPTTVQALSNNPAAQAPKAPSPAPPAKPGTKYENLSTEEQTHRTKMQEGQKVQHQRNHLIETAIKEQEKHRQFYRQRNFGKDPPPDLEQKIAHSHLPTGITAEDVTAYRVKMQQKATASAQTPQAQQALSQAAQPQAPQPPMLQQPRAAAIPGQMHPAAPADPAALQLQQQQYLAQQQAAWRQQQYLAQQQAAWQQQQQLRAQQEAAWQQQQQQQALLAQQQQMPAPAYYAPGYYPPYYPSG